MAFTVCFCCPRPPPPPPSLYLRVPSYKATLSPYRQYIANHSDFIRHRELYERIYSATEGEYARWNYAKQHPSFTLSKDWFKYDEAFFSVVISNAKSAFSRAVRSLQAAEKGGDRSTDARTVLGLLYEDSVLMEKTNKTSRSIFATCTCRTTGRSFDHQPPCSWYISNGREFSKKNGVRSRYELVMKAEQEFQMQLASQDQASKEHKARIDRDLEIAAERRKKAEVEAAQRERESALREEERRRQEEIRRAAYQERMRTDPDFRQNELLLASQLVLIDQQQKQIDLLKKLVSDRDDNN